MSLPGCLPGQRRCVPTQIKRGAHDVQPSANRLGVHQHREVEQFDNIPPGRRGAVQVSDQAWQRDATTVVVLLLTVLRTDAPGSYPGREPR